MRQGKFLKPLVFITVLLSGVLFTACSDDDDNGSITVSVNGDVIFEPGDDFFGDVDGDFTGTGGSGVRSFNWLNALPRADYNADITATTNGRFQMVVQDANGNVVLDRSLEGGVGPDSIDGITTIGLPGIWTVTITLTNFNGDGSFSLSQGD